MHRLKNNDIPKKIFFTEPIKKPKRKYPKKFSKNGYTSELFPLSYMKHCIAVRGSILLNEFSQSKEKEIQSY